MNAIRLLGVVLISGLCLHSLSAAETERQTQTQLIDLWSGNRTPVRVDYEREVMVSVLNATQDTHGPWQLKEELSDYSEEAEVFKSKGHDVFVTVAGNKKFNPEDRIAIPTPIVKG